MAGADITVIIPAYNEGQHIKDTLASLSLESEICEIIVVDDASVDGTLTEAKEAGARVVRLEKNVGKGRAVMAAFPFINSGLVMLLDADLKDSARFALALAQPVLGNSADLAVARFPRGHGGKGFGFVKKFSRLATRLLTGKNLVEPLSGQRCMKKQVLRDLFPLADRYGLEVGMNIDALRKGYRIVAVEAPLYHSPPGRDWQGFLHRGAQLWDICQVLIPRVQRKRVTGQ